jgi:hypothetical protein
MKYLLSLVFLLFSQLILAQDQIILTSGEEIRGKVTEVGVNEIKYYKAANLNGPVYVLKRSEVFMIKYENGNKDVFNGEIRKSAENKKEKHSSLHKEKLSVKNAFFGRRYYEGNQKISKASFINKLKTDPEAYDYYSSYSANKGAGRFFSGVSMIGAIYAVVFSINNDNTNALIAAIGGLVSGTIGRIFEKKANDKLILALSIYNKHLTSA